MAVAVATAAGAQAGDLVPEGDITAAVEEQAAPVQPMVTTGPCGPSLEKWGALVPDRWGAADFRLACQRHDRCYSPASTTSRLSCDVTFLRDLRAECHATYPDGDSRRGTCERVASTYFSAVRGGGGKHYRGSGPSW